MSVQTVLIVYLIILSLSGLMKVSMTDGKMPSWYVGASLGVLSRYALLAFIVWYGGFFK